jgi:hypothetical protein
MKFAAIVEKSIQHEGDERSRTNPGHGYPAYTETVQEFVPFTSEADMNLWVQRQEKSLYSRGTYRVIQYEELTVKTVVTVQTTVAP